MNKEELMKRIQDKKAAQAAIKQEYEDKEKVKALTTAERLDRIERLLGLSEAGKTK